jgi:hypothetical protein
MYTGILHLPPPRFTSKQGRKELPYGSGHLESELLSVCEGQVEGDVGALHAQVCHDKLLGTVALVLHVQGCDLKQEYCRVPIGHI